MRAHDTRIHRTPKDARVAGLNTVEKQSRAIRGHARAVTVGISGTDGAGRRKHTGSLIEAECLHSVHAVPCLVDVWLGGMNVEANARDTCADAGYLSKGSGTLVDAEGAHGCVPGAHSKKELAVVLRAQMEKDHGYCQIWVLSCILKMPGAMRKAQCYKNNTAHYAKRSFLDHHVMIKIGRRRSPVSFFPDRSAEL